MGPTITLLSGIGNRTLKRLTDSKLNEQVNFHKILLNAETHKR